MAAARKVEAAAEKEPARELGVASESLSADGVLGVAVLRCLPPWQGEPQGAAFQIVERIAAAFRRWLGSAHEVTRRLRGACAPSRAGRRRAGLASAVLTDHQAPTRLDWSQRPPANSSAPFGGAGSYWCWLQI